MTPLSPCAAERLLREALEEIADGGGGCDSRYGPGCDAACKRTAWRALHAANAIATIDSSPKVCGCGATYTRATWVELGQIAPLWTPADEGPGVICDQRNCRVCGSTLGVEVRPC